jgi:hypothetical protein
VLSCGAFAEGTGAFFANAGTPDDFGVRQIVGTSNVFGGVRQIFTGTGHDRILLDCKIEKDSLPILTKCVRNNPTNMMLLSQKKPE